MSERLVLHVVPHTHWDREWYDAFEVYRYNLVKMVDRLLGVLSADPGFRHFNFDGQTAAIEDYLDVRPEREGEVARLVRDGRLAVGPWRILMDEFLCSPETIVRNLQQGRATALGRLGRRMRVGYIPDSFGHVSQMPQLLRLAGIADACVFRGVPAAVDRTVFRWEAPDGSEVRTLYLATTYSNAATLPESFEDLMVRAKRIVEDLSPFQPGRVLLGMNGTDHRWPESHLPAVFAEANERQAEIEFRLGSLEEYLADAPAEDLPRLRGEMRSGARANVIMGVASARMWLKQAEFRASSLLERAAEPLAAIAGLDPGRLLDRAWRWMVENSAHDSICGCGVDEVATQVAARYEQAARIATLVAHDGLATLAARVDKAVLGPGERGVVLHNPSPFERAGVAEVTVTSADPERPLALRAPDGSLHAAQVVAAERETVVDLRLSGANLAAIIPTIHSRSIGPLFINDVGIEASSRITEIRLRLGTAPEGRLDVEATKRSIEQLVRARPRATFRVLGLGPPLCRAVVRTPRIGGLGWTVLVPVEPQHAVAAPEPGARAQGRVLDNGILRAEARDDGSLDVVHLRTGRRFEGLFALEDGGEAGDEYNYCPPDRDRVVRGASAPARVQVVEHGPLRATLTVGYELRIPAGLAPGDRARSRRTVALSVTARYTLQAGEPFVRATLEVDNRAADHRLRALFPLPFRAGRSHADGAFDVVERGLEAEGGPHEPPLATFPSRRWVDASSGEAGLAVLHRGTPEYELVGGAAIAVTLLRCVGWLSRQGMRTRVGPAGPLRPTPAAQGIGHHRFELAAYPHAGDWAAGGVHRVAESYAYEIRSAPIEPLPGRAGEPAGDLPGAGAPLDIAPGSVQLSALVRDGEGEGEGVSCRIYNASAEPVVARLAIGAPLDASRACLTDLFGGEIEALAVENGVVHIPLRGRQIATVRLA